MNLVRPFWIIPALLAAAPSIADAPAPAPWLSQPALSPDGREITFSSGGDLWSVPASGGEARLLVSHAADDRRPIYSPDGKRIAFVSDRTGNGDLYVLTLANGALARLTYDDGVENPDGWSADGAWIYFSSNTADISGMQDVYRVRAGGGTPMAVSAERYTNEFAAAPSPDGHSLLMSVGGIANAQWWRRGHSHIDESEIWLRSEGDRVGFRRLIGGGAKALWPMWAPDGRHFYFMSDRSGSENLWSGDMSGAATPLTHFDSGRLLWPSIAADGRTIVFERDFGLWTLDTATGTAHPVVITLHGAPAGAGNEFRKLSGDAGSIALSPDGKKIALVVHGEVFAISAADGGEATRVTRTPAAESDVAWAPDSRRIVYVSTREGASHVYLYDFTKSAEARLTTGDGIDVDPEFSPDGRQIAFLRDGRELRVMDPDGVKQRLLASGVIDLTPPLDSTRPFTWSPDSKWIAYLSQGARLFRNASVVSVEGASPQPIPVSFLANLSSNTISWSPDASFLLFDTSQRTEPGQVARVDLVPHTPRFREQQFRDLFKEEKKPAAETPAKAPAKPAAAKKPDAPAHPVEIVRDDLRRRLTLLPVGVDVQELTLSPDGKQLLLIANAEGSDNLYLYSLDELAKEPAVAKQLTSTSGAKGSPQFSPDGKTVYYLDGGAIQSMTIESRQAKPVGFSAGLEVDFDAEKEVVFDQAWGWLGTHFHDPRMNGVDWSRVRQTYAPRVAAARTSVELARLLSMMVGELNASHSGVRAPGNPQRTTGRIGVRFDRSEYERTGALKISGLVPLGPAAVTRHVAPGEYLLAVDGTAITAGQPLESLLENRVGHEVRLALAADARGTGRHEVTLLPVTQPTEKELLYREWVEKNRAAVTKLSGGRLGYVHMTDMSYESLLRLGADLDAENMTRDGVVFDIRNNNGGFVNVYALDVLARRPFLNMTFRGWPTGTARTILGQRSLEKPTVLLTNQHSLSDAEDFAEGYRSLGLGKVIGEPTAGWIIYTSNVTAVDGTTVRIPFITITTAAGEPMEMHPRPVDIEVHRALGEDAAGHDSQLERAVEELLKSVKK